MPSAPVRKADAERQAKAWRSGVAPVMVIATAVVAAMVYARLLGAPFLSWDDDRNILMNPMLRAADIGGIWRAPYFGLYVPVTGTAWAVLWQLGGGSAVAFRAFNLAMHIATTLLVWRLLARAMSLLHTGGTGMPVAEGADASAARPERAASVEIAAALGAAVFALHPLQVAAVAWISGGRDLLATFLAVAALLTWLRRTATSSTIATALFALALLAKPSVAAVPIAVVLGAAVLGRAAIKRAAPLMAAWLGMAIVVAAITSAIQDEMTGLVVPAWDRAAVAADALGFYVIKLVAPYGLAADYGRTPAALLAHAGWLVPTLVAVGVAAVVLGRLMVRRDPCAAWGVAAAALWLPVLGLATFAYQRISTVADHYAYLPMVAVAGLVASVATRAVRNARAAWAVWAVLVLGYGGLSWGRGAVWRSDAAFFGDMVAKNPTSFSGLSNLAKLACDGGDARTGAALAARALAINATNPATLATRADCLYREGDYGAVIAMRSRMESPAVQFALDHDDGAAAAFVNTIAGAFFLHGDLRLGLAHLCQAIALSPGDSYLRENLSDVTPALTRRGLDATCHGRRSWEAMRALGERTATGENDAGDPRRAR